MFLRMHADWYRRSSQWTGLAFLPANARDHDLSLWVQLLAIIVDALYKLYAGIVSNIKPSRIFSRPLHAGPPVQ